MDAARELAVKEDECVVFAETQLSGRGKPGREWISPEGGLWCSFLWKVVPDETKKYLFIMVAASVVELLGMYGIEARIKLPNDVYAGNKKIAGILIENSGKFVIIGIGLNVNNNIKEVDNNAVSCSEITGRTFSLDRMLENLTCILDAHRKNFPENKSVYLEKYMGLIKK